MTISRGQMNRQLYMGGGIMGAVPRENFFLGKAVKAVTKPFKKAAKTVSKIASSDLGKAALLYAGTAGLGALGAKLGSGVATSGFGGIFNPGNVLKNLGASKAFLADKFLGPQMVDTGDEVFRKGTKLSRALGIGDGKIGNLGKLATLGAVSTFLTQSLGMTEEQAEEEIARDPSGYLERYYRNLNPNASEEEVTSFVAANTSEYAVGGRVGFKNAGLAGLLGGVKEKESKYITRKSDTSETDTINRIYEEQGSDGLNAFLERNPDLKDKYVIVADGMSGKLTIMENKLHPDFMDMENVIMIKGDDGNVIDMSSMFEEKKAEGGRIGFADGPVLPPDPTQPVNPFGPKPEDFGIEEEIPIKMASDDTNQRVLEALFEKYLDMGLSPKDAAEAAQKEFERMSKRKIEETRGLAALGGRMNYALGDSASENAMQAASAEGLPIRQNPKGIRELDLRDNGGFIPPVGIKEKADDIPAMLSNNEFVMTADAVRGMGDGDVNLGAQRMYDQMKMLEAGGKV
tara:strand:- start:114 stop:1661 length:1548 start_codon:yes stop_codon:yes gene_type:complete